MSAANIAYRGCHYVCGFVSYTWLLIKLVNLRIPEDIACLRRNLTGEKMLNSWCWTEAKSLVTILIYSALSVRLWGQPSHQSVNPFCARSQPSVICSEEYENYCHIWKLNIRRIMYSINCFYLLQASHSLHILPHQHWGVISNNHGD